MNLIEIIFLTGAHCVSPLQTADGITDVSKVACAVVVKQDQMTAAVILQPDTAATDPRVIAVLGKSLSNESPTVFVAEIPSVEAPSDTVPDYADATSQPEPVLAAPAPKIRMVQSRKARETVGLKVSRKKKVAARRQPDQCGSYRAVWFTNKEGRRRYRCVRA